MLKGLEEEWYWLERARMSVAAARGAANAEIAKIHMDLYERHMRKAGEAGQQHTTESVLRSCGG